MSLNVNTPWLECLKPITNSFAHAKRWRHGIEMPLLSGPFVRRIHRWHHTRQIKRGTFAFFVFFVFFFFFFFGGGVAISLNKLLNKQGTSRWFDAYIYDVTVIYVNIVVDAQGAVKNAYERLNLKSLEISTLYKNHIFQCMGKIFCVEFPSYPWKFHTK